MTTGPLNRVVGILGLIALIPTAAMSLTGNLTPPDTAVRAGATLALVLVVRKVARWYLSSTASAFERRSDNDPALEPQAVAAPGAAASQPGAAEQPRSRRRDDAQAT